VDGDHHYNCPRDYEATHEELPTRTKIDARMLAAQPCTAVRLIQPACMEVPAPSAGH
ncbi:hypothetical protein Dimus_035674, partial [Dionaea muscipula]